MSNEYLLRLAPNESRTNGQPSAPQLARAGVPMPSIDAASRHTADRAAFSERGARMRRDLSGDFGSGYDGEAPDDRPPVHLQRRQVDPRAGAKGARREVHHARPR